MERKEGIVAESGSAILVLYNGHRGSVWRYEAESPEDAKAS